MKKIVTAHKNKIAVIAHDNKKDVLLVWTKFNQDKLSQEFTPYIFQIRLKTHPTQINSVNSMLACSKKFLARSSGYSLSYTIRTNPALMIIFAHKKQG